MFEAIYFILPSYIANMFPVIFGRLRLPLGIPINQKKLGKNKTYRGFYAGYLGALITLYAQTKFDIRISIIDYDAINIWFYAFLFGFGAILGDAVKSYFKRRFGIVAGEAWVPFDQLDFVIGALIFLYPFAKMELTHIIWIIVLTPFLHLLTNIIAYLLRIKPVWW